MNSIYYLNYASVLFEMARQQKKLEKYTKDSQILFNTFYHNHDLQRFFANASIPATYRKQTFLNLFKNKIERKMIYFVWAIIDFKRIRNIQKILKVFLKLAQQELGILFVKVTSAFQLRQEQKNKINLAIRKRFHNNKVYIYNIVDPSIIGGLKIESGSLSIDGTLRNKLNLIKEETYKTINSGEIMGEDYGI